MNTYSVSDFLIRLKNACLARRRTVTAPYSKLSKEISRVLVKNRFLESAKEESVEGRKVLHITLSYEKTRPVLSDVEIISKPSLRVYVGKNDMQKLQKRGYGISVLSTNKGILTAYEAKKQQIGGEFLFRVW